MNEHFRYHDPQLEEAQRGARIPAWIFRRGLSGPAIVTWGVMARCVEPKKKILHGFSAARLAAISGLGLTTTRRAIDELSRAGVIHVRQSPGKPSSFGFFGPAETGGDPESGAGYLTWKRHVDLCDDGGQNAYWRAW